MSLAPQACGSYPLPHLGPDLFGHCSCSLVTGDNSRVPAGLASCTPLPCFPGPGPSCLEGTGFWQRPGPLPSLSPPLAWALTLPGPSTGSVSALFLCPGQGSIPHWHSGPPTRVHPGPTWTADAPAALAGSRSALSARPATAAAYVPGCGPHPARG